MFGFDLRAVWTYSTVRTHPPSLLGSSRERSSILDRKLNRRETKLQSDGKSHAPGMYQGILQNETDHFPTFWGLKAPRSQNVLLSLEQTSGVGLGLGSGPELGRVR